MMRSASSKNKKPDYKVVLWGSNSKLKSEVYKSFKNEFSLPSTIGVDFLIEDYDDYRIMLWDTIGQERFRCISETYLRNVSLVFHCELDGEKLETSIAAVKKNNSEVVHQICIIYDADENQDEKISAIAKNEKIEVIRLGSNPTQQEILSVINKQINQMHLKKCSPPQRNGFSVFEQISNFFSKPTKTETTAMSPNQKEKAKQKNVNNNRISISASPDSAKVHKVSQKMPEKKEDPVSIQKIEIVQKEEKQQQKENKTNYPGLYDPNSGHLLLFYSTTEVANTGTNSSVGPKNLLCPQLNELDDNVGKKPIGSEVIPSAPPLEEEDDDQQEKSKLHALPPLGSSY